MVVLYQIHIVSLYGFYLCENNSISTKISFSPKAVITSISGMASLLIDYHPVCW